ncbi:MAG: hypothetical protein E6H00_12930 [Bacillati bacterium ANGP1]|uniref:Lipoprotein n=1 Tax=Candidatus Segetimicrobium genomatis TaxID=2569760 RepID=A0A537JXR5_9BACT|nr:MAG: hypothetical protein E6H00_12930 [Terrabacteria group bacterium ANGP1]
MATKLSSKKPLFFAVLSLSLSGCCAGKHYIHRGSLAGVRQEFGAGTYTASAYRFRYVTKDGVIYDWPSAFASRESQSCERLVVDFFPEDVVAEIVACRP